VLEERGRRVMDINAMAEMQIRRSSSSMCFVIISFSLSHAVFVSMMDVFEYVYCVYICDDGAL